MDIDLESIKDPILREQVRALQQEKDVALGVRAKEELEAAYRDTERHEWQRRKQLEHNVFEGFDKFCSISDLHLDSILRYVFEERLVLFRAPPGSGKTSMAEAFQNYSVSCGFSVYHVSLIPFQQQIHQTYDKYFAAYYGNWGNVSISTTFSAILNRASERKEGDPPLILILDESQCWFGNVMPTFWARFKELPKGLVCLCFSAFGDQGNPGPIGSPVEIRGYLGFPELQLNFDQLQDVVKKIATTTLHTWSVSDVVLKKLLHSNGQARIIRLVLDEFSRQGVLGSAKKKQLEYLRSQDYFRQLLRSRVFLHVSTMYNDLDKRGVSKPMFLELLFQTSKASEPLSIADSALRSVLLSSGVFYQDNEEQALLFLLCPAAYDILLTEHMTGEFEPLPNRDSFERFLLSSEAPWIILHHSN